MLFVLRPVLTSPNCRVLSAQCRDASLEPCVVEAEAQSRFSVEQPKPDEVHVGEHGGGLGRDGGEDHVLEYRADKWPDIIALPQRADAAWKRGLGPVPALRFQLRVTHVLVQPRGEAFTVVIDNVIVEPKNRSVDVHPLAEQVPVIFGVTAVHQLDIP